MKKMICSILIMAFILILLPLIIFPVLLNADLELETVLVTFLMLLLIINPLAAIGFGLYSGFDIRSRWFMPIAFALIGFISVLIYKMYGVEDFFVVGSAAYLVIGIIAMIATHLIKRLVKHSEK